MIDLAALLLTCAPLVAQDTARALIQVESGGNPFAIGVVGGALVRQPTNLSEAVATASALEAAGWNYSVGLGQINKRNFERYGLNQATAFEPCANLTAMQGILGECFSRASQRAPKQAALRDAFSCYYSGNFSTGHQHGYVGKVIAAWSSRADKPGNAPARAVAGPVLSEALSTVRIVAVTPRPASLRPTKFTSTNPGAPQ